MFTWLLMHAIWFIAALFVALLLSISLGRVLAERRLAADPEATRNGTGAIEGVIFALLGLLMAFTFSGASTRFEQRRELIVTEANAIGTAWLRLDVLPADAQPPLRDAFRRYVDSRLAAYADPGNQAEFEKRLAKSVTIQKQIWQLAVAAGKRPDAQPASNILLLPALNEMIDITTTRAVALKMHQPAIIFVLLIAMTLVASVLAGLAMAEARAGYWFHRIGYAAIMAVIIYVIIDLEHPRIGLIRVDSFDAIIPAAIG